MLSLSCWHVSSSRLNASPRASFVRHMFLPGTFPLVRGHIFSRVCLRWSVSFSHVPLCILFVWAILTRLPLPVICSHRFIFIGVRSYILSSLSRLSPSGTSQAGSYFAVHVSRISFHRRFRFHAILVLHCFLSMRFVSMGYLSMLSGHTFQQIWLSMVPALPSFYVERGSFSFQLE
ncbi:hypothetical protein M514_16012 [Trichuris suis]|uniref:Uncharacterized protein n=1 Tax=Trichuris suis TaxID=68888 RepID=A0A085NR06_9BILA|nr:hypothetical protein M514_16012 [Trichuris suis]